MELGIGPIVTAGLILQLLVGSNMIQADMGDPEDRGLFTTASKVFSIVLTGVQASAYIIGGMYGTLTGTIAVIVFLQLIAAGIVVLLLDELVQKGWGFGSGISLFIMAGVAQHIFWQSFSPAPAVGETGSYGFFVQLGEYLTSSKNLSQLWLRQNAQNPSLVGLIATISAFLVIIYMEGVRVELPLSYAGYKGYRSRYPIKLLYVSNLPVIFASALFANVYFFSQLFWGMSGHLAAGKNLWLDILGQFKEVPPTASWPASVQSIGGLVYYVTAPTNLPAVMADPLRALGYLGILTVFCVVFSLTWLEVGRPGSFNGGRAARRCWDADSRLQAVREGHRTDSEPLHSCGHSGRRNTSCTRCGYHRLFRSLRFRNGHPAFSGHNLPVLRDTDARESRGNVSGV